MNRIKIDITVSGFGHHEFPAAHIQSLSSSKLPNPYTLCTLFFFCPSVGWSVGQSVVGRSVCHTLVLVVQREPYSCSVASKLCLRLDGHLEVYVIIFIRKNNRI